ncbi:MAG: hypothetical protein PUB18_00765 [bacterium]|nr:hypothetical protein [bacterium]
MKKLIEVCSLVLAGKNGKGIIGKLKEKHHISIIVISTIDEMDKKLDLFEFGADDHIMKPFYNEGL